MLADRGTFERADYRACELPCGTRWYAPDTSADSREYDDTTVHGVGNNVCGRTHFRMADVSGNRRSWKRKHRLDNGHHVNGETEGRGDANRIDEREQFAIRTAQAVCDQIGLCDHYKREVCRLIDEKDVSKLNGFGGLDAAIVGFIGLVVADTPVNALRSPFVHDAIDVTGLAEPRRRPHTDAVKIITRPQRVMKFVFDEYE